MFTRPTALAAAFVTAAADSIIKGEVSNDKWIARVVAHNATERGRFGMVTEYDRRPGKKVDWPNRVDHTQVAPRVLNVSSGEDAFIEQHGNMLLDGSIGG